MFNLAQNCNIMNNIYFSIIILATVFFFILSVILVFQKFVYQEKLKIQSEEIRRLSNQRGNELLDISGIHQRLEVALQSNGNRQDVPEQEIENLLKSTHFDNDDWDRIRQYINDTQNHFVLKLVNKYPTLSHQDINFILLMRLKVPNEQIAAFYNIQLSSLATKRYRLMKKMGLKSDTSIVDFINNLFSDEPKSIKSVYDVIH